MTSLSAGGGSRWARDVVDASTTMAAVLTALGLTLVLRATVGGSAQDVVLAVVLTLTLSRLLDRAGDHLVLLAVEVPVIGLAAAGAGELVLHEPWIGQPLLVVALSVGILARRYGGLVRQAGRVVALPFLALLVTPAPQVPHAGHGSLLWAPVVSLIALGCAVAGRAVAERAAGGRSAPSGGEAPAAAPTAPRPATRRRLDAPTRMAAQMAVGLGASLILGHLLFGAHWPWAVVSAFIVASGNRGRGDVAHKAALRVLGAGVGTLAATGLALHLPTGDRAVLVALFAAMFAGLVLRRRSYAFWAAGVTAMIALLHAYYGGTADSALQERILGVLLGSLLGLAAAWFVLPVRTSDVLRRRIATCLAALTDDLDPDGETPPAMPRALHDLDQVVPALTAHRRTLGRRHEVHPTQAVQALHRLADPPVDADARRRLRRDVVRVRRSMVGRDDPSPDELPTDLRTVHAVLRTTARTR